MPARHRRLELRDAFGQVVRALRIKAGLSQEQLSFRADVHRTYVGDLERGLKSPTLAVVDRIATALSLSAPRLVELATRRQAQVADGTVEPTKDRQRVRVGGRTRAHK